MAGPEETLQTAPAQSNTAPPEEQQAASAKKKPAAVKELLHLLIKLVLVAAAVWAILSYVIGVFVVHSNDMYPAVRDGDLLITYRIRPPARGDIVAYTARGERRVGRVVGIGGDVIELDEEGHFTVNGGIPFETIYYITRNDPESALKYPYVVPTGSVFVLNDLRDNMSDSRRFGAVGLSDTDGSAALLLRRRSW